MHIRYKMYITREGLAGIRINHKAAAGNCTDGRHIQTLRQKYKLLERDILRQHFVQISCEIPISI